MDPTTWVLDRIVDHFSGGGMARAGAVRALAEVIGAMEGRTSLVFGMVLSAIDMTRAPEILALARDAIASWGPEP